MEAILSFLFSNLFLVIVVLGVLTSLFGRSGRKGGGSRMPDFGGGPGGWQTPRRGTPGGPYRSGEAPARPVVRRRPEPADAGSGEDAFPRRNPDDFGQVVYTESRPNREHHTNVPSASAPAASRETAASSASDLAAARSAEATRVAPALQVEQLSGQSSAMRIAGRDELRNAVIWAEILGPPRAFKPHGRRRAGR